MSSFLDNAMFQEIRNYIYLESGINFSDSNRPILESRLKERLRDIDNLTPASYLDLLRSDKEETRYFLDAITTNLTWFFRNQAHYDLFINYIIPTLVQHKTLMGTPKIRVWSAGCSTGEEAYTNAMVLKENLPPNWTIEVLASDLSLKSLIKAKIGFYPSSRTANIPPNYLSKYLTARNEGYQVNDAIRDLVQFNYHNLKFNFSVKDIDIVFCRNVLIYFDEEAQKNVITHFWNAMGAHSYLLIGHSESLLGMNTQFEFIKTKWACVYSKITG